MATKVFIINLLRDVSRLDAMTEQFSSLPGFKAEVVEGIYGPDLPDQACLALVQHPNWKDLKGTIGCFLSHVKAWEAVAKLTADYAVIVEDDVELTRLSLLDAMDIPINAEIVFLNDRMSAEQGAVGVPDVLPMRFALAKLDTMKSGGPGGDGYLLRPKAAIKLLDACREDYFYGHVDGRLLRYATAEEDLDSLAHDTWIGQIITLHHHPTLVPTLGLTKGYCLSDPIITHRGVPSSREAGDSVAVDGPETVDGLILPSGGSVSAQDHLPLDRGQALVSDESSSNGMPFRRGPVTHDRSPEISTGSEGIPIRYWDRITNIGDRVNPYVVEHVSGRIPFYSVDETEDHVLGVGSILFMANRHSHIWGAGMLNPASDYSHISPENVHAVRGKLTADILRRHWGVQKDLAIGDPGVLVDELPELVEYKKSPKIKRRVAIIPHYAMIDNPDMARLARETGGDILDPRTMSLNFMKEILSSELVISQSLHGLVFAETLGKPSVWISHDESDLWTFKFHDWFTNVIDPPEGPLDLSIGGHEAVSAARLTGLNVDRERLKECFPLIPQGNYRCGIDFRMSERESPLVLCIDTLIGHQQKLKPGIPIPYRDTDEEELRAGLNEHAFKFNMRIPAIVAFDQHFYEDLQGKYLEDITFLLTNTPDVHFFAISALDWSRSPGIYRTLPSKVSTLKTRPWSRADGWPIAIFIRNLYNFSFTAPGLRLLPPEPLPMVD